LSRELPAETGSLMTRSTATLTPAHHRNGRYDHNGDLGNRADLCDK